jgi:hypothetical protein
MDWPRRLRWTDSRLLNQSLWFGIVRGNPSSFLLVNTNSGDRTRPQPTVAGLGPSELEPLGASDDERLIGDAGRGQLHPMERERLAPRAIMHVPRDAQLIDSGCVAAP